MSELKILLGDDGTAELAPEYEMTIYFETQNEMDNFGERVKKMKWHDLRENPADLPKEMEPGDDFSVDVLLAIRFDEDEPGDEYTYTVGYVNVINDDTFEWWACTDSSSHRIIKPSHVVKWRYID